MSRSKAEPNAALARRRNSLSVLVAEVSSHDTDHQHLQLLIRLLPIGVWTTDSSLNITYAAGLTGPVLNHLPETLYGRSMTDLLEVDDPLVTACRDATEGKSVHFIVPAGDRIFAVSTCPPSNSSQEGCFAVALDVTGQHQAQHRLASSEDRYRDLIENVNDLIYTLDMGGRITSVSRSVEKILGYTREEVLTMRVQDLFAPEQQEFATGTSTTSEAIALAKDGRRVHLEVNARLRMTDGGVSIECIGRDITDRRELEDHLRQAQKMEAIGVLAGGIAHDFNNLLTGILGFAYMLQADQEIQEKASEALEVIIGSAERAAQLTRQLLGFARREKTHNIPVDIHSTIRDLSALLHRTIDKKIRIHTNLLAEGAFVMGDPGQMYQLLLNLCVNARDAMMPSGGDLNIRTRTVADSLVITVSDTGSGIAPEIRDRIFEPFFTTKSADKGTGMGLAMVYGIAHNHGGTVDLESTVGEGSSFIVTLPVCALPTDTVAAKGEAQPGRGRILVVDDEEIVLQVLSKMLRSIGYDAVTIGDSREAITYYGQHVHEIDAVILDMIMPGMSGRDCYHALRELDPDVRVIVSSGYSDDEAADLTHSSGLAFLQKPYQFEQLSSVVGKVVAGQAGSKRSDRSHIQ